MSYVIHTLGKGKKVQLPDDYRVLRRDAAVKKDDKSLYVQGTLAFKWGPLLDDDEVGLTPNELQIDCVIRKYNRWDEDQLPDKNYKIIEEGNEIRYEEIPA